MAARGVNPPRSSRRRFLKGTAAAGLAGMGVHDRREPLGERMRPGNQALGAAPNILVFVVDEMRYPTVYEADPLSAWRETALATQTALRESGVEFTRHYAASVGTEASRTSLYTGHYPSLHGVSQTIGAAKDPFDPSAFGLDPDTVPTFGDYFRSAGYRTFFRGRWSASNATIYTPGTHLPITSYDGQGFEDPDRRELYNEADRLHGHGFRGWIGPDAHTSSALDTGSSVAPGGQGRDEKFADQTISLVDQLAGNPALSPWIVVCSFVNPGDIALFGRWVGHGRNGGSTGIHFDIDPDVPGPRQLFAPMFRHSNRERLLTKPSVQWSFRDAYAGFLHPDDAQEYYFRLYYQLHKNVDVQMGRVLDALEESPAADDTIVVFTSSHGTLLGAHGHMHQKWYTAYDESIRVPLVIRPAGGTDGRQVDAVTSHVDVLPTLLGMAGQTPEELLDWTAHGQSDAVLPVGRDLSGVVSGESDPADVRDPIYFMTDDDPSRGLDRHNFLGVEHNAIVQPSHIETVIVEADFGDGLRLWKLSRYFDSPRYWTHPEDEHCPPHPRRDVTLEVDDPPEVEGSHSSEAIHHVKLEPLADEYEMYDLTEDPMELRNLILNPHYSEHANRLRKLLRRECETKRLGPASGRVPGQPDC
ncbi:MAG: sulfatase-like hydrolase/transferase [Planctomycetota bacterium]|nr:sulfatase-like hydrolase/transferase [Planctomycetota bacterium]MDP6761465.1 sulfatase-like hydrolase/transferase [Planctomycetota bacterium]MDP6988095.1 sulfatase-like hydrolase/transferase [Planctomycetota bacterium]